MVQILIDGTSPVLSCAGTGWKPVSRTLDPFHADYSNDTARTTCVTGDQMSFTFFGTNASIFGARRNNHGLYTAGVDSSSASGNGFSGPEIFQSLLFSSGNLTRGSHQLHLSNTPNDTVEICVDVDWIEIDDEDPPSATGSLFSLPSDPALQVLPSVDAWQNLGGVWQTDSSTASMKFTFTGGSAAIYGRVDVENSPYMCSIDNESNSMHSSYAPQSAENQMMCYAGGLDPTKQHTIQVFNYPNVTNPHLQLTHAQAWQVTQLNPSHKASPGLIVGITAGITIFLGILIAILVYIHRRQRSQRTYIGTVPTPDPSYDAPDAPKLSSDALLNRSLTSGQIDSPLGVPSATHSISRPAQPPSGDTPVNALNSIQPPTMSHASGSRSGGSLGTIPESLLSGSLSTGILSSPSVYSLATQPRLNASQTLSGSQYSMGTTQRGSFATLPSTIHYPSIQGTLMTTASSLPGRSTTGVAAYYPTRPTRHATDAGLLMRDGDLGVLQDDTRSLAPPGYLSRETSPTVYVGFSASLPLRPTLEPQPVRAEVE